MRRVSQHGIIALLAIAMFGLVVGCSDSNSPTSSSGPAPTATTTWVAASSFYRTTLDGSNYTNFMYYSFTTKDTLTTGTPKPATATNWDVAFRRTEIKLNGGTSTVDGGTTVAMQMDSGVAFSAVTAADSTGKSWTTDAIDYAVDHWYNYNTGTHQLDMTRWVYSIVDAGGHNYAKFRVDSIIGAGMPPNMGTVYITYYYNPTADSKTLSGAVTTGAINVGSGTGYFDFSSGAQVTPADPANSTGWDIAFNNYNLMLNSGPDGSGSCAAFDAFTELTDSTDINAFTAQPTGAPMFPDQFSSIFSHGSVTWYDYNSSTHVISSKGFVYLIKSQGKLYKLMIEGYYANVGGSPVSGHYTFIWNEI
jgi:hypothetical protein